MIQNTGGGPLRVFVSGTQEDLQEERAKAAEVIRSVGGEPLLAETSGSIASSSEEVCVRLAASCDLYVGIYGLRYGSVPPKMTVSVTELEFETARGADPTKILVYRKQGEAEARQEEFLTRVRDFRDGYFHAPPFTSVEMLGEYLRRDIPLWIAVRVRQAAGRPRRPAEAPSAPSQEATPGRRPLAEEDLAPLREAVDSQDSETKILVLKDLISLSNRVLVEHSQEVRSWLARFLRGSVALRTETLRAVRFLLGHAEREQFDEFRRFAHGLAQREFVKAKDLAVKQEALNLFGLVVTMDDLEMLLEHVTESSPEFYDTCRPLYAFGALKETGHEAAVRQALYRARREADAIVKARIDDILEYVRYRH